MTLKEFMKRPNPHLDKIVEQAERQREAEEEQKYNEKVKEGL